VLVMQVANFVYLYTGKECLILTMRSVMEFGVDDAADIQLVEDLIAAEQSTTAGTRTWRSNTDWIPAIINVLFFYFLSSVYVLTFHTSKLLQCLLRVVNKH